LSTTTKIANVLKTYTGLLALMPNYRILNVEMQTKWSWI